jgi:hypothetical protein
VRSRIDRETREGHPWPVVTPGLDTLLSALYVETGDHVIPSRRRGRGQPERLSDGELACLAVAHELPGARSEHYWLRICYGRLGHLFPYLPHQPGCHKRPKAAPTVGLRSLSLGRATRPRRHLGTWSLVSSSGPVMTTAPPEPVFTYRQERTRCQPRNGWLTHRANRPPETIWPRGFTYAEFWHTRSTIPRSQHISIQLHVNRRCCSSLGRRWPSPS